MVKIIWKNLQQKIGKYILCGYSLSTIWAFDHIKNNKED